MFDLLCKILLDHPVEWRGRLRVRGGGASSRQCPGGNCIKIGLPENRFSETIFKRIRLPEDPFSYWESVFREDLSLYNSSQDDVQPKDVAYEDAWGDRQLVDHSQLAPDVHGCNLSVHTGWSNWILHMKWKYSVCCFIKLIQFLLWHLSKSILNTSSSSLQSSWTTLYSSIIHL